MHRQTGCTLHPNVPRNDWSDRHLVDRLKWKMTQVPAVSSHGDQFQSCTTLASVEVV